MRLAILILSMAGGGAERVISYFLPFLEKRNIEVHLILMNSTVSYNIPKGIPIHYIDKAKAGESGTFKLLKLPLLAYRYSQLLKKIGATHSFSLLTRPNYINLLVKRFSSKKYKFIISERNYPSEQYGHGGLKDNINKYLIKKLYDSADSIICNSKENGFDLANNFNCHSDKIQVIYNPIDKEKIDQIHPVKDYFDPNYFNVISVGRLQPVKNHELLIRAVKKRDNVRLYILGQGELKIKLESIIKQEKLGDRVFLLGFDNNPYKYLKSADLFALSSNHEGFPNVLLEAMACRLPIVSTNCMSGPSELMELKEVKNNLMPTDYGILVPVNDVDLMAKAINHMSTEEEFLKFCRKNCGVRVLDYDTETILTKFLETIQNC